MLLTHLLFKGESQQLRGDLYAPDVTQVVLPMCPGFHWTACGLVVYAETYTVWNQLCAVYLLPAEPHFGGLGGLPFHTARGKPDTLCWPCSAEVRHLHLHPSTGDSEFTLMS